MERGRRTIVFPPGPPRSLFSALTYVPGGNPLGFFADLKSTYGDVVHVHIGGEHVYLLSHPRFVRDVLVTHQHNFRKGRGLERAKPLLGQGLLTSEGQMHVRQRRLMQPAFHRDRIATYATAMTEYAERRQRGWRDGATLDIAQEMNRLTLGIVGKTLFDQDVDSQAREVGEALTHVLESFWLQMLPFYNTLERLPIPALRRSRQSRAKLDAIIYAMIAERRQAPRDRGDLLSMLLLAQDEEGDHRGMSDTQVRDEAMTIFLAGHETTANALSWTWYLLSGAPDVAGRVQEEVDRVLRGRTPTLADVPALPYIEQVVTESMRLYPPAWIIGRRAIDAYPIDEFVAGPRSILILSPYLIQRDARFFPEPERFQPERWTPAFKAALPSFAYFPFGGGARRCIGESFAWMELILLVSSIAQRWTLELVPGHPVVPQPVVTLRLKHGLKMRAHARRNERVA